MKTVSKISTALVLLLVCIGVGFQIGKHVGFKTGSEWALIQADMLAREAGVFMPVYMEDDTFRVVIKQPRGSYKKAWELADRHEEGRDALRTAKLKNADECQDANKGI